MGNSNDIKKVEAALKAIKDLEVLAKEPGLMDVEHFCEEYDSKWKAKIDEAIALVDGPLSDIIIKLVPYLPLLLTVIKSLKLIIEQSCSMKLGVQAAKDK